VRRLRLLRREALRCYRGGPKIARERGKDGDQITQQRLDVMNCFAVEKKGLSMKLADGFFWRVFHTYIS